MIVFTIHIHGFLQKGTPWADGTGLVTTCPIQPTSEDTIQRFTAPTEPGVYLYHGHVVRARFRLGRHLIAHTQIETAHQIDEATLHLLEW